MPVNSITSKQTYQQLWLGRDTIGSSLLTLVLDSYGQEIFELDPTAFRKELEEGFQVADIPEVNTDKVWTLWLALTSDLVHQDVSTFINAANVLNGTPLSYDVFDIADVYECAWAITELTMLDPETPNRLSPEVKRYIGEVCKEQGLYRVPGALKAVADLGARDYAANVESHATDSVELQVMFKAQQEFSQDVIRYVNRQANKLMIELNGAPLLNKDDKSWNSFVSNFSKSKP